MATKICVNYRPNAMFNPEFNAFVSQKKQQIKFIIDSIIRLLFML